jgi:hypothetical protein
MDRESLDKLRELRRKLKAEFTTNTKNSVAQQLFDLTWDVTSFEVFLEIVRLAPEAKDGGKQLNGMIYHLLSQSFFNSFMVRIRKLIDKDDRVSSLVRVLMDMEECHVLFTRELMLECEADDWAGLDDELIAIQKRIRHNQIDQLCRVTEKTRSPNDRVKRKLFQELRARIRKPAKTIIRHVNNNVAHATRADRLEKMKDVLIRDLHASHKALCEVAGFVNVHLLGGNTLSTYVHPSGNPFLFLERPLCPVTDYDRLREKLTELEKKFDRFAGWNPFDDPT